MKKKMLSTLVLALVIETAILGNMYEKGGVL